MPPNPYREPGKIEKSMIRVRIFLIPTRPVCSPSEETIEWLKNRAKSMGVELSIVELINKK